MNIAFLAHDKKKELMVQFCTAYKSVLIKHNLFATATTGRLIGDNTGPQTHVHRVGDAIQPSHLLSSPSPPAPQSLPSSLTMSQLFA